MREAQHESRSMKRKISQKKAVTKLKFKTSQSLFLFPFFSPGTFILTYIKIEKHSLLLKVAFSRDNDKYP